MIMTKQKKIYIQFSRALRSRLDAKKVAVLYMHSDFILAVKGLEKDLVAFEEVTEYL